MESLSNENLNRKSDKGIVITAVIAVILVLLALVTRLFILTNFITKGSSMEPTYHDAQRVWVLKTKNISHGDVIVIWDTEENKYLIKRVIAFEGDSLRAVSDNENNYRIQIKYKDDSEWREENYEGVLLPHFSLAQVDLLGCIPYDGSEYTVQGDVFLMGDYRLDSWDSRDRGEFPLSQIQGIVIN